MTLAEIRGQGCSVFRVYWKSGGDSVASIYMDAKGDFWIAPSNWLGPAPLSQCARQIHRMVNLDRRREVRAEGE